ncbi:hypothetical protein Malapachy_3583 [Malassezia pachydermatis]|uniref:Post-GPI attachment to proteins factor 3 n=1 Tax=Malassezia pachydermatis TaxID=77020 RepID=A0A0M8MZ65_9BASI|nr:hypothetical protein Malapachy_3583 [Malassezia pachydermatis]KOS16471.1 hypothetical protein Malapachy_3583 [Malassezia pachydermatis]
MRMRTMSMSMNEHWKEQLAWEKGGEDLKSVCGEDSFLGESGVCLPLMLSPPPPVPSEADMRRAVELDVSHQLSLLPVIDKETVQFFGKWPHLRVLGMQEPMSVVFSLMNLAVQVHAIQYVFRDLLPSTFPLRSVYLTHAKIASVAWCASSVFHTRDLWWTERFDYFSAAAVLVSGFFLAMCRILSIRPGTPLYYRIRAGCILAWVLHVLYLLSRWRLDYSYNMAACLVLGVMHNVFWLLYAHMPNLCLRLRASLGSMDSVNASIPLAPTKGSSSERPSPAMLTPQPMKLSNPQRRRLELLILAMFAAPALELFDFPPLFRLLDAHALWHLVTVPLTMLWYHWLADDARECVTAHGWHADHHDVELTDVDELAAEPSSSSSRLETASMLALPVSMAPPSLDAQPQHPTTAAPTLSVPGAVQPLVGQAYAMLTTLGLWGWQVIRLMRGLLISS